MFGLICTLLVCAAAYNVLKYGYVHWRDDEEAR
jgi:hypothetical protein